MARHLLGNLIADGSTAELSVPGTAGGYGTVFVTGTFDSATTKLEMSPDSGATFADVEDTSLTANGAQTFQIISDNLDPIRLKGTATGGGGSLDINFVVYFQDRR